MATETANETAASTTDVNWQAGAVGGVIGSLAMGVLVLVMNPPTVAVAIPSLYTLAPPANVPIGLVVHLFHGAVLGVVFAGIVSAIDAESTTSVLGLGLGWGVVTWAVLAALVMPQWLAAVGSPASPPFPNFAPPSLLWHVVYGLVLGGVFVWIRDRV